MAGESTVELLGDKTCSIPTLPYPMSDCPQMFLNYQKEVVLCGKRKSCLRLVSGEWHEYLEFKRLGRKFATVVSMDSKTYMFGGEGSETSSEILQDESWKVGPTIPGEGIRYGCGVAISKEELLLIGGGDTKNRIIKYNIKTKNWTEIASLKVGRVGHSCILFKDQVFIIGGFRRNGIALNSVEILSLDTMTMKEGNGLQVSRRYHGSGLVHHDGKLTLAVFGGYNTNDESLDSIERFDEDTGTWKLQKTLKLSEKKQSFCYLSVPSHLICP